MSRPRSPAPEYTSCFQVAGCVHAPHVSMIHLRPVMIESAARRSSREHATTHRRTCCPVALAGLGVGVGATWGEEDGGSSFLDHDAVVAAPAVVGPAGGSEDVAQQGPEGLAVDIG